MRIPSRIGTGLALAIVGATAGACTLKSSAPFPDVASFCKARAAAECQIASTCGIHHRACAARVSVCNEEATGAMSTGTREYVQANAQACIDLLNASNAYGGNNSKILFAQLQGKGSIADVCGARVLGSRSRKRALQDRLRLRGREHLFAGPAWLHHLVCAPQEPKDKGAFCSYPGSTCAADTYCAMPSQGGGYQSWPPRTKATCDATTPCIGTERARPLARRAKRAKPASAPTNHVLRTTTARRPHRTVIPSSATHVPQGSPSRTAPPTATTMERVERRSSPSPTVACREADQAPHGSFITIKRPVLLQPYQLPASRRFVTRTICGARCKMRPIAGRIYHPLSRMTGIA